MSEAKKKEVECFPEGFRIDRFRIYKVLGHGGFGQIYAVQDIQTNKEYALKYETADSPEKGLIVEERILQALKFSKSFPNIIYSGLFNSHKFMVIELLGPSLSNVRRQLNGKCYTQYSATYLSFYTLCCIEKFHNFGYIHRDIKPGNFLIRPDWNHPICMIDFGLSTRYLDKNTGKHIPFQQSHFVGTCKYASMNAHEGIELSRRDDMISWFYSCVEFFAGKLPWPASKDKAATYEKKKRTPVDSLFKKLPNYFRSIYDHIFNLGFEDAPDYFMIKDMLLREINSSQQTLDWETIDPEIITQLSLIPIVDSSPRPMMISEPTDDCDNYFQNEEQEDKNANFCCKI